MGTRGIISTSAELTDSQFDKISRLVKGLCGISLGRGKKDLVNARLRKRLRKFGFGGFDEYLAYLRGDSSGDEVTFMLDALTTNLTSFFREADHFEYLAEEVLADVVANAGRCGRRVRLWSAGCSTGEEPYCLAIVLRQAIADLDRWDARVLATDLSTDVLATAAGGVYADDRLRNVPPRIRSKYFQKEDGRSGRTYRVADQLRSLVCFARLNLMEPWPMRGPFDAIFCRNVMIYFDKPTQSRLVRRFWQLLRPGGTLFIGHSESLAGSEHEFRYVQPTVYEKP